MLVPYGAGASHGDGFFGHGDGVSQGGKFCGPGCHPAPVRISVAGGKSCDDDGVSRRGGVGVIVSWCPVSS